MNALPLSRVRSNLSSLVRRAARGTPTAVTVRGRIEAYLVGCDVVARRTRRPSLKGSLKLLRSLTDSRAAYLEWLRGEG